MPEGPSIVIVREALQPFVGKKVLAATGNTKKVDFDLLAGDKIVDVKSWGKHLLICFKNYTLRIHFLMFGSYRINEEKEGRSPRLKLTFPKGQYLVFYTCAITTIQEPIDEVYDWTSDVMNADWDPKSAIKKLKKAPQLMVCDALLDQQIFSGVGNIIKNEVLYRIKVHPETKVGNLPPAKRKELLKEAVHYSFQFLEWKQEFTLKKHWLAYAKKICPRDHHTFKKDYLGKTKRRTFYCTVCQKLY